MLQTYIQTCILGIKVTNEIIPLPIIYPENQRNNILLKSKNRNIVKIVSKVSYAGYTFVITDYRKEKNVSIYQ